MQYFIPYVAGSEAQTPIQVEKELALAFLVGLSREERGEPTALMKVQYPFRVYTVDDDKIIFDLLGYSESDKHLLLPKDLSEILFQYYPVLSKPLSTYSRQGDLLSAIP